MKLPDYYAVLRLTPVATQGQIKAQFYALSRVYHPDAHGRGRERSTPDQRTALTRKFHALTEAYSVLGDAKKRRTYDEQYARTFLTHNRASNCTVYTAGGRRPTGLSARRTKNECGSYGTVGATRNDDLKHWNARDHLRTHETLDKVRSTVRTNSAMCRPGAGFTSLSLAGIVTACSLVMMCFISTALYRQN